MRNAKQNRSTTAQHLLKIDSHTDECFTPREEDERVELCVIVTSGLELKPEHHSTQHTVYNPDLIENLSTRIVHSHREKAALNAPEDVRRCLLNNFQWQILYRKSAQATRVLLTHKSQEKQHKLVEIGLSSLACKKASYTS